ncbi:hypothetical protein AMS68_007405 [Peltaster fructicola]|uniref:Major facilitator superfamily (MFS) profile domain-containing protein n=1 Tax=Peltaster fructicola TaxID=286661 RepID=A0A6H0Y4X2_9PEZI|nr:hypothetical protein AMS68_007405 [Peltaster fructicola]
MNRNHTLHEDYHDKPEHHLGHDEQGLPLNKKGESLISDDASDSVSQTRITEVERRHIPPAESKSCKASLQHEDNHEAGLPSERTDTITEAPQEEKAFEVRWDGPEDPHNPKSDAWASIPRKWSIVLILSASSLSVTCASALYTSTYDQLEQEFGISRLVATLGLTIFVCGLGLGPMLLSPLSEFYGRRPIYLVAFGIYLIWLIPCAVAPNVATLMVARFFDGLAGSAFLSVAGGTVGDTFPTSHLSLPMLVYTASPFLGPATAPIMGGFINFYLDWRWSFYILIIWAGVQWLLILAFVPETYSPVLLRRKARRLREETGDDRWKAPIEIMDKSVAKTVIWSCIRPMQLLVLEPMCLNLCLLSAILLGILYLFFGAFAVVFTTNHDFNLWQTGLVFCGIFVGMILGVCCDPITRKYYRRIVSKNGGVSEPEFRLPPTIVGAVLVPISLFGFGWTTYSAIHWIVPIIFSAIFGLGNILCFGGIFTFLVECYPLYAASALAANSLVRSGFAAAFPLFGVQMYTTLGFQWASSLLGFIALAMMPFPFLFFRIGKRLRASSRFASVR